MPAPTDVTQVAAGPAALTQGVPAETPLPVEQAALSTEAQASAPAANPNQPSIAATEPAAPAAGPASVAPAEPATPDAESATKTGDETPGALPNASSPDAAVTAPVTSAGVTPATAPQSCDLNMTLAAQDDATIGVIVTAPCHADQRAVLTHAGLAITLKATGDGMVLTEIPALSRNAEVQIKFGDGAQASGAIDVPEAATVRRFGVQWQGVEGFGVHGFENGAGFDQPGDVSAANPHTPISGIPAKGGHLMILGDSTVDLPLLAEVYTWPADPAVKVDIVTEAAVTRETCGADLLGETLNTFGGETLITDLTVAMPSCDTVGDYLVLKNLALDPKLAAAN